MDQRIEDIKKRLGALEEGLSDEEKGIARAELDKLITEINTEIEVYLAKLKVIEIKQ